MADQNLQCHIRHIAVLLPLHLGFARRTLSGIAAAAQPHLAATPPGEDRPSVAPWNFLLVSSDETDPGDAAAKLLEEFCPHAILARMEEPPLRALVSRFGVPTVELFQKQLPAPWPGVGLDNVAVVRMAAEHFLERGFRHFAVFGDGQYLWSRDRYAGLQKGLEEAGRWERSPAAKPKLVGVLDRAQAASSDEIGAWLAGLPRPLAVFATNDRFAVRILNIAREAGLRVPEQIAVLGAGANEVFCGFSSPPLSSVRTGLELLGAAAVKLLERMLAGEKLPAETTRVLPGGVMARSSTDVLAESDAVVAAAIKFIRGRREGRITVDDVAEATGLNRRTLERRFARMAGRTVLQEIHRAQVQRMKLLLAGEMSQEEIAELCEFSSVQRMAHSFELATGMTPSEYRRWERMD